MSQESFIQCFSLERLDSEKLSDRYESGAIQHKGKISKKYLYRIKETVKNSKLLTQQEIESVIQTLGLS